MDFGKVEDITKLDFSLPPDSEGTAKLLAKIKKNAKKTQIKVYVGCPVWSNKNWLGTWYPSHIREKDFLKYYARQFNTIELNTTHYRIPDNAAIQRWKEQTNENFKFAPKFPQEISHQLLPEGRAEELTFSFCDSIRNLEANLGISFLQLPPYFTPNQIEKIEDFLLYFPKDIRLAFEFRHPDWFIKDKSTDNTALEKAASLLEAHQIATVITDVAGRRDVLHMQLSSPAILLRFVGNSLHDSDYSRVDAWVQRFKTWIQQGLEEIYFFVHEPDNNLSPELAGYFIRQMNLHCALQIAEPTLLQQSIQGTLF